MATGAGVVPPLLDRLLRTPGPSGFESGPVAVWRSAVEAHAEVSEDALGSVLARLAPRDNADRSSSAPTAGIFTHIDEIGLIVKAISPDGYLLVDNIGGWDPQILVGQRVEVLTASGSRHGVIGRKAIHQMTPDERKAVVALKDLRIDIGAGDREQAAAIVDVGDPAVLAAEPVLLPENGRLVSRSIDNRISAYIAAEAIGRLAEGEGAPGTVIAVASVQEETSLAGARAAAYAAELDLAVVIDVTHASDGPGASYETSGEHPLGSGPVITRGAHANPRLVSALRTAAERRGIPYTLMAAGGTTATDADAVHVSRGGIPTVVLSVPLRYMHSPVEMIQLSDVEHTIELLLEFLSSLAD